MRKKIFMELRDQLRRIPSNRASEESMSAKYNYLIDNTAFRLGLIVVGFAAWFAASIGLLAAML
jgi:hypothetical protein